MWVDRGDIQERQVLLRLSGVKEKVFDSVPGRLLVEQQHQHGQHRDHVRRRVHKRLDLDDVAHTYHVVLRVLLRVIRLLTLLLH